MSWAPEFDAGSEQDGEVEVHRFPVPVGRDVATFNALTSDLLGRPGPTSIEAEERWMSAQGPVSPALLTHLEEHGEAYDAIVFVPYLYATTAMGLPLVAARSVLVPALHDEGPAYLGIMKRTFRLARAIGFLTPEERTFARRLFGPLPGKQALLGIGISEQEHATAARLVPDVPYVLYVGRIDPSKGSPEMFDYHRRLSRTDPDAPLLVVAGRAAMEVPEAPWLRYVGFVSEAEKPALIKGSVCAVLPSPYESLSISTLEAWSHGRPVVVSAGSEVLVGQVRRANGGLWFSDAPEYAEAVTTLAHQRSLANELGANGRCYVRHRYRPDDVIARLEGLLHEVTGYAAQ